MTTNHPTEERQSLRKYNNLKMQPILIKREKDRGVTSSPLPQISGVIEEIKPQSESEKTRRTISLPALILC